MIINSLDEKFLSACSWKEASSEYSCNISRERGAKWICQNIYGTSRDANKHAEMDHRELRAEEMQNVK